ncbi:MAG: glycosyltransferase family 4 protein [Desulfovibrio sp.]|jgi:UDP-glucose:(heptosyl)LPS alpha-1,3-glucosyltransferase|nr:glycosyltransferase family 4 protein [Desulfovibrio sp.]
MPPPADIKSARIAILLPRFSLYGGVEQFGFRLAEGLAGRGHRVDFICSRREAPVPPGVRIISTGRPPAFRLFKMLCFLIQAERLRAKGEYDLSIGLGQSLRQDLIRMGGGPLKIFRKKSEQAYPPGFRRTLKKIIRTLSPSNLLTLLLERRRFGPQSRVIAVSGLVREWLLQAHPALDPDKIDVVYNRPDAKRFRPPALEERREARSGLLRRHAPQFAGDPENFILIGTASTNFRLKGVDKLIKAVALLPENFLLLTAGGRGPGAYLNLARSLGLERRVIFTGKMDNMPSFYRALDLFALPTFYDACSNAVLEALASGCRTLGSAADGSSFFLEKDAVLEDPSDVEELARRITMLLKKPAPAGFSPPPGTACGLESFMDRVEFLLKACDSTKQLTEKR